MDNHSQHEQQQLVIKLLVILATGLVSVVLLGVLLYIDDKQQLFTMTMPMHNPLMTLLLVAALCLTLCKLYQCRSTVKQYLLKRFDNMEKPRYSITTKLNGLLFAVLVMSLLLSSQVGMMDKQQFFFLSLLSAVTGMMLARIWNGLMTRKSEA